MKREQRREIKRLARKRLSMMRYLAVWRFVVFSVAVALVTNYISNKFSVLIEIPITYELRDIILPYFSIKPAEWALLGLISLLTTLLNSPVSLLMSGLYLKMTNSDAMKEKIKLNNDGTPIPPATEPLGTAMHWLVDNLGTALALGIQIWARRMAWWAAFYVLPIAFIYFGIAPDGVCALLLLCSSIGAVLIEGRFFPAYFYAVSGDSVIESLRKARHNMRGRLSGFAMYKLSFFWWYLLVGITFGIAMLFVAPYCGVCDALYVRRMEVKREEAAV